MALKENKNILTSWKEIANYLNCSVRTCMRWEKKYNLPVHRIDNHSKTTVYAYKNELDVWIANKSKRHSKFLRFIPLRSKAVSKVFLFFLFLVVFFAAFFIPKLFIDPIPTDFIIQNSTFYALNKNKKKLWKFETGVQNLLSYENYKSHFQYRRIKERDSSLPYIVIKDISNDGKPEVLFSLQTQDEYGEGILFCFDYKGNQLWKFEEKKRLSYGDIVLSRDYRITGFDLFDMDGDGKIEISIILSHRIHFATQMIILDSQGNRLGEYWNSGRLSDIQFVDLNKDGRKEILVSGCNNEYEKGCLIVFDTTQIEGSSPQTNEDYICRDLKPGTEKYYVLFPRTDVDLLIAKQESINQIAVLENNLLSLTSLLGNIIFDLNYELKVVNITLSHSFLQNHKLYRLDGKIKSKINEQYIEKLKQGLLYWDGKQWVKREEFEVGRSWGCGAARLRGRTTLTLILSTL